MPLPIVIIHRGDDDYLTYSLQQAKRSNPHSPVYLIGNVGNRRYVTHGINHEMIDNYMHAAMEFTRVYKHIHFMPYEYNLFCFQRWFILLAFMKKHHIPKCCYIDTDVMLYTDVNHPRFDSFMMEFVWTNFVDIQKLEEFCTFMTSHFANPISFAKVVQYTMQRKDQIRFNQPLITDMVVALLFLAQFKDYQMTNGLFHDGFIDGNIQYPASVENLYGYKKIYAINGSLCCKDIATSRYLPLFSLHFQGYTKHYMKYFTAPHLPQGGCYFFDYISSRWIQFM
ncbi:hypothetical protein [Brevibacillus sp. 179-C9.3 HS]|uniref:hypothetical protein n=1 Tax=unclassified Brevibacillus TaxID=2684853 RepID=UPI0039A27330